MAMSSKSNKLLSWKETWLINKKALQLIHRSQPGIITVYLISCAWSSLAPYAGIWLLALILEELSGSRRPERLLALVLAALICAALISLVEALLKKRKAMEEDFRFYYLRKIIADKMMDMDFCIVDDSDTDRKLSQILQTQNSGGWGLARALHLMNELLGAFFTLVGGIAMTVTLFTSRVPDSAGALTVLNNPLFLALIVALMLAVTYIAPLLSNKADSYFAVHSDMHTLANRLFSHYGFMGQRKDFAADMRIYRQDTFCEKYMNDKTGTFGSQGYFAGLAKGPMGLYFGASSAVSVLFTGVAYLFVGLKAWAGAFGVGLMTQYVASIVRLAGGLSSFIGSIPVLMSLKPERKS